MDTVDRPPRIIRWTLGLEDTTALDRPVKALEALVTHVVIGVYAASWIARRRRRHGTGVHLGLAGAAFGVVMQRTQPRHGS